MSKKSLPDPELQELYFVRQLTTILNSSVIKHDLKIRNLVKTNLFAFFALNQGVIIDLNLQLILKCPCCPQFLHSLFGQFMVSWPTFALKSWHKKHTASIFLLKTWLYLKWNKIYFDLWFFCFEYSTVSTDFCTKIVPFTVKVRTNFHMHNTHLKKKLMYLNPNHGRLVKIFDNHIFW